MSGNFTWRDDFTDPALSPLWIMLRTPTETWWSLDATRGQIQLTPRAEKLAGTGNPSFLARRLQHAHFEASTSLTPPTAPGVSAGLAAFQSETHHYFFGVRASGTETILFVELHNGGEPTIVAEARVPAAATLQMRLTGHDGQLTFSYATTPDAWQTLADAPTQPITVQAAGGGLHFTGAVVGLHARLDEAR